MNRMNRDHRMKRDERVKRDEPGEAALHIRLDRVVVQETTCVAILASLYGNASECSRTALLVQPASSASPRFTGFNPKHPIHPFQSGVNPIHVATHTQALQPTTRTV